ncbi:RNA polymerase subunit sigma-70 [Pedobacter paludis]|uniref:RNA polymerase subunit sigma-70 n=1 Tax=Pedobacter paludis TaxID=2203212 RepID=A0A317F1M2_9SPHI|nr:RNA polymerase subunit sigma-70 [Pedobacter paludis]
MESPYNLLTDNELLALLNKGDENAFSVIYERYWPLLLRHAKRMLSDDEDVRDVLQEVFSKLWNQAFDLEINTTLASYLYALTRNRILNVIAHQKVRTNHIDSLSSFMENEQVATDYLVRERQLSLLIEKEIALLPEKMRVIFDLSRNKHLSYKEIAQKLSISENTVKKQINNALKILRLKLGLVAFITFLLLK